MEKEIEKVEPYLDVERTNKLFDISIIRADANSTTPFDQKSLGDWKVMVSTGNLHLNTAKAKVQTLRLIGYRDNLQSMNRALKKKTYRARKGQAPEL